MKLVFIVKIGVLSLVAVCLSCFSGCTNTDETEFIGKDGKGSLLSSHIKWIKAGMRLSVELILTKPVQIIP